MLFFFFFFLDNGIGSSAYLIRYPDLDGIHIKSEYKGVFVTVDACIGFSFETAQDDDAPFGVDLTAGIYIPQYYKAAFFIDHHAAS